METTWAFADGLPVMSKVGVAETILKHGVIPVSLGINNHEPELITATGETTRTSAFVLVNALVSVTHLNGITSAFVSSVAITAYGEADTRSHRRKTLPVVPYHRCHAETPEAFAEVLESLSPEIDRAVGLCTQIDALYAKAAARTSIIRERWAECATREGYEAACAAAGVSAIADSEIMGSYGVAYGVFTYPEYAPDHIVRMGLADARRQAIQAAYRGDASEKALSETPVKQGQIWEPCQKCGHEPSYLPLHLCNNCWPIAAN